ncbi:MAG: DnaA regulatory inactivator Hda [Pseudomonadota bacterium]
MTEYSPSPLRQLPLPVGLRDDATLDNFLVLSAHRPLLAALREQLRAAGEGLIYIHGPAGVGKSHLLQASCHAAAGPALYLPLAELKDYQPDAVLQDVANVGRLCLDDLDAVAGDPAWERALFGLCEVARTRDCQMFFAADSSPRSLAVELQDLRSRLAWGVVFKLPQASDAEKARMLAFRAARRGISLAPDVASYIVNRAPRGTGDLLAVLEQLDRASLAEQRALSQPFVKRVMQW